MCQPGDDTHFSSPLCYNEAPDSHKLGDITEQWQGVKQTQVQALPGSLTCHVFFFFFQKLSKIKSSQLDMVTDACNSTPYEKAGGPEGVQEQPELCRKTTQERK